MNKNIIGAVILSNKALIIKMYQDNMRVTAIAEKYGVVESTIYSHLKKWGIPLKRGVWIKQAKPKKHWKRKFSDELMTKFKENSRINNERVQYVKFGKATRRDQYLIHNIINRPIIG